MRTRSLILKFLLSLILTTLLSFEIATASSLRCRVSDLRSLFLKTPKLKAEIPLSFRTFHPQGLYKVADTFYLTSVDSDTKIGHLFKISSNGKLLEDITLRETIKDSLIFHPGGIDFDGDNLWIPLAEYRPGGRSIIYKYSLKMGRLSEAFTANDHIGALLVSRRSSKRSIIGLSWGSYKYYIWDESGTLLEEGINPFKFVEFQDGGYLGKLGDEEVFFASGIRKLALEYPSLKAQYVLGGLTLFTRDFKAILSFPITLVSSKGRILTWNPAYLYVSQDCSYADLYLAPDDEETTIYVYRFSKDR